MALTQRLFDRLDQALAIRRGARREARQHTAMQPDEELLKIPGDITWKLGALACQQTIQRMAVRPIHFKFAAQREGHAVVETAERTNGVLAVGLLLGKLIARQPEQSVCR